jgi:thiaminase (transcriptional activator TenA)
MVLAIGAGTLPHEIFRGYFEQNILYLRDYARAIALTLSKAPDAEALATLTAFLMQIVANELPANAAFLERLGGDPSALVESGLEPSAYAYTRHMLSVCAQGDCAEGLTAVLPCQWSYGEIARPLMAQRPADPIYADWIAMFGNPEYDALVEETTGLLDRLADPDDGAQMHRLTEIFERSTQYEVAFWDMAYAGSSTADRSHES